MANYDYSLAGGCFITISTHSHKQVFGTILEEKMYLNQEGLIAQQEWEQLPRRFANIGWGPFVVMPNHIHGIVMILESDSNVGALAESGFSSRTLGSVVRAYKAAVSYRINRMRSIGNDPVWQRNYYEHIIRNSAEMEKITAYIDSNPAQWQDDVYHPKA